MSGRESCSVSPPVRARLRQQDIYSSNMLLALQPFLQRNTLSSLTQP